MRIRKKKRLERRSRKNREKSIQLILDLAEKRGEKFATFDLNLDTNELKDLMKKGYQPRLTKKGWLLKWS